MMGFMRLIGCSGDRTASFTALVKDRNNSAHTNGQISYSTQAALDTKIAEILRIVQEIQTHSKPVIERCYREFLLSSRNADDREYPDPEDQIREVLIHENYLSHRDLDLCRGFALSDLAAEPGFSEIQDLHRALQVAYPENE